MATININFKLARNATGQLQFTNSDCAVFDGVHFVRAFPISAPDERLSIISHEGHELAWIASLVEMPTQMKKLIETDLLQREFMPVIALTKYQVSPHPASGMCKQTKETRCLSSKLKTRYGVLKTTGFLSPIKTALIS